MKGDFPSPNPSNITFKVSGRNISFKAEKPLQFFNICSMNVSHLNCFSTLMDTHFTNDKYYKNFKIQVLPEEVKNFFSKAPEI